MGSFSIWHWLVVLLIVVLIFGTKRLKSIGSDMGGAVKGFREAMRSGEEETRREQDSAQLTRDAAEPAARPVDEKDRQSS